MLPQTLWHRLIQRTVGAAVLRPLSFVFLVSWFAAVLATSDNVAVAQFGGTQDWMLEKQQRQQQQISKAGAAPRPSQPSPPHSGHSHKPHVNNYYFQTPGYLPYGYNRYSPVYPYNYDPYGYGDPYGSYYANPYALGPVYYPPRVTVLPHGAPMTSGLLNGAYGEAATPYGNWDTSTWGGVPPGVQPEQPQPQPQPPRAPADPGPPAPEDEIKRRVAALKPSTDAGRLLCDELIAEGDREFANQEYRKAASKYRAAIAKAPDYPPGHLRAGHAYIASGDYELAVTYLAMGFELARTIQRPGFSLTDLYQGNDVAKDQHQESLADAILRQPGDGGLLFLSGINQHYDGRPLQARDYFRRAAELPGRHQPYAAMFLPGPAEPDDQ